MILVAHTCKWSQDYMQATFQSVMGAPHALMQSMVQGLGRARFSDASLPNNKLIARRMQSIRDNDNSLTSFSNNKIISSHFQQFLYLV
jgi:hypothetical protein